MRARALPSLAERAAGEDVDAPLDVTLPRAEPLVPGVLQRRYKRFLADVRLADGSVVVAHCVNTGAMEGLTRPGRNVWLRPAPAGSARKLLYTWELLELPRGIVGVDTGAPNRVVKQLLERDALPWLRPAPDRAWEEVRAEVRYGERSRIDFHLRSGDEEMFLEVKNCHLVYDDGVAYFPDSVSERAAHHVAELAKLARRGQRAHVLFFVQMPGVLAVKPSDVHDPAFAAAARRAHRAGVGFSAISVAQSVSETRLERRLPVLLDKYPTAPVVAYRDAMRVSEYELPARP